MALKMWAYSPQNKSPKKFLVYIFPKRVYPLKRVLQNFAWERVSLDRSLMPNVTAVALKMWLYSPKIAENGIFC